MKFAFLPNQFKKIGLWCFFGSVVVLIIASIIYDFTPNLALTPESSSFEAGFALGLYVGSSHMWFTKIFTLLLMLGMGFYMLAKEKLEDDYLDILRWDSVKLSILICIVLSIFSVLIGYELPAYVLLLVLFTSYLITFKVKKTNSIEP